MAKNQWMDEQGEIVVSESNPNKGLDFQQYAPVVNPRRVKGATYQPYAGASEWARAANRRLWDMAHRNFERGRR